MFTSEPTLPQRLERMIGATPVIDPHSYLNPLKPQTPDLGALLSERLLQAELKSVGMPVSDFDGSIAPNELVRRAVPYLKKLRNTTVAWCFYRILRDLYDFTDYQITKENYLGLCEKVAASGTDSNWADYVLKDRCRLTTIVTSFDNAPDHLNATADHFCYMLELDYLFTPGVPTGRSRYFQGRTKPEYLDALTALFSGERPVSAERLGRLVFDWLDLALTGKVKFATVSLPTGYRMIEPDVAHVDRILSHPPGTTLYDIDFDALSSFVSWKILEWHHENRKTLQLNIGSEPGIACGTSIPGYDGTWAGDLAPVFQLFSQTKFDILMGSDLMSEDVAVLARQFPNVYLNGYSSQGLSLSTIEKAIGLRLQIAPMTKVGGFLSDCRHVEWTYAKYALVKRSMASAFAHMVYLGFQEEHELPPIFQQILHDTPAELYRLG